MEPIALSRRFNSRKKKEKGKKGEERKKTLLGLIAFQRALRRLNPLID